MSSILQDCSAVRRMKAIRALLVDPISTDFVLGMIFGVVLTVGVLVAQILVTVWDAA